MKTNKKNSAASSEKNSSASSERKRRSSASAEKKKKKSSAEFAELSDGSSGSSVGLYITLGVILLLLLIGYGVGVYYYNTHFFHNTYVNNARLGEMTVEEAEHSFTHDFSSHKIAVKEKERSEIIDPQDVDAVIAVGSQIQELKDSQNRWLWFTKLLGKDSKTIYLDVSYDAEALEKTVSSMECFKPENVNPPEDAYIKIGTSQFEIVPEVLGNTVKKEELIKRIGDAFATCETKIDLEGEDLYVLPKVYAKDEVIINAQSKANKYAHSNIVYDFSYTKEYVDYETIKDWIKISKEFKVTLDKDKMRRYISGLCNKYNTMGSSRDFTTSSGEEIHVYDGDYGWKIDNGKELDKLVSNVKSGEDVTREPEYEYRAQCRNSARDDIGSSYVEVNLTQQEVWLYIDGSCIANSSCVSGKPVKGRKTYPGVYSITYKQRDATLVGENYSSPVKYWMPFDGNRGLHDASWRSSFGGNIYKRDGSHGCVNLPTETAEILFKYVDTGFPVVIYKED